jgi:hypothetical protein
MIVKYVGHLNVNMCILEIHMMISHMIVECKCAD